VTLLQVRPLQEATHASGGGKQIRVMVVDDSAVIRVSITRALESDPDIQVVRSASNGQAALQAMKGVELDVIVLDIEMPIMDGLTALPLILAEQPKARVVVASTLSVRGAEITMRALQAGASECIAKPSAGRINDANDFQRDLVSKVRALAGARLRAGGAVRARPEPAIGTPLTSDPITVAQRGAQAIKLRAPGKITPRVIAIGSSTGGPQALAVLLAALPPTITQPILITQHMPPTFTAILAQHLTKAGTRAAAEGQDGEMVKVGRIYVAPGDHHMLVRERAGAVEISLSKDPPENFCRPSVDPMLRSLTSVYGPAVLCAMLTGMGSDGLRGARTLVEGGGTMIAQDEASSVVWGMPGAVATAGLCSAVMPLPGIANEIARLAAGRGR
jgi:two-component system, chemotaxis family, protein-glutamate methylesterase/glutaminase